MRAGKNLSYIFPVSPHGDGSQPNVAAGSCFPPPPGQLGWEKQLLKGRIYGKAFKREDSPGMAVPDTCPDVKVRTNAIL